MEQETSTADRDFPELVDLNGDTCIFSSDELESARGFLTALQNTSQPTVATDNNHRQLSPQPKEIVLSDLASGLDIIPEIELIIARKYPLLYYVKQSESSCGEFLSARSLELEQEKQLSLSESEFEKWYPIVDQRIRRQILPKCPSYIKLSEIEDFDDDVLVSYLHYNDDPELLIHLSVEKRDSLEKAKVKLQEQIRTETMKEVELKINHHNITGVPVLRFRVLDKTAVFGDSLNSPSALLSIWRPSENVVKSIQENSSFKFFSLKHQARSNEIGLSFTRESLFEPTALGITPPSYARRMSSIDVITTNSFNPVFEEIDLIGKVAKIRNDKIVTLCNQNGNEVDIQFYRTLKELGLSQLIRTNELVCGFNIIRPLIWRNVCHAQEVTFFKPASSLENSQTLCLEYQNVGDNRKQSSETTFPTAKSVTANPPPPRRLTKKFIPPRKVMKN